MNTDNTTISGETIDYGPCAFMERYDPQTVFSSIDHAGRYAFGNQPGVLQWNLARFAEAILPLLDPDQDRAVALATGALERFAVRFLASWRRGLEAKLGIADSSSAEPDAERIALLDGVPALLESQQVDQTLFFRRLSAALRGDAAPVRALFADPRAFDAWEATWLAALNATRGAAARPAEFRAIADAMDRVNPIYVPRNQRVEEALSAATLGDLAPFRALLAIVTQPYEERPGLESYAQPAPADAPRHRTYCGT